MKRIETYLQNSDTKEKVMLYASFPILIFIFYYNFVYTPFIAQEAKLNKNKKELIKKISNIKSTKFKYKVLQKKYYTLQTDIESLLQDYRYSKISFNSLEVIKLSDEKFFSIVEYLLSKAKKRGLDISLSMNNNIKINKHFNNAVSITIDGKGDYVNFVRYIKDIENINSLVIFKGVEITEVADDVKAIKKLADSTKTPFSLELSFSDMDALDLMKNLLSIANSMRVSITPTLRNGLIYISGKGDYSNVNAFIKYLKKLKNVKVGKMDISLKSVLNTSKTANEINKKHFVINFNLVGMK